MFRSTSGANAISSTAPQFPSSLGNAARATTRARPNHLARRRLGYGASVVSWRTGTQHSDAPNGVIAPSLYRQEYSSSKIDAVGLQQRSEFLPKIRLAVMTVAAAPFGAFAGLGRFPWARFAHPRLHTATPSGRQIVEISCRWVSRANPQLHTATPSGPSLDWGDYAHAPPTGATFPHLTRNRRSMPHVYRSEVPLRRPCWTGIPRRPTQAQCHLAVKVAPQCDSRSGGRHRKPLDGWSVPRIQGELAVGVANPNDLGGRYATLFPSWPRVRNTRRERRGDAGGNGCQYAERSR